jgi:hypothetical protein
VIISGFPTRYFPSKNTGPKKGIENNSINMDYDTNKNRIAKH